MSLLFMDGMDYYVTSRQSVGSGPVVEKWTDGQHFGTSSCHIEPDAGRFGGGAIRITGGSGSSFVQQVVPSTDVLIVGWSFKVENTGRFMRLALVGDTLIWVVVKNDQTIGIINNDGDEIANTVSEGLALNDSTWYHMELKLDLPNASVELRVNEETWIQEAPAAVDTLGLGAMNDVGFFDMPALSAASGYHIDDVYIMDDAGSRLNDFIGDARIDSLLPIADGTRIDFTANPTGPNYENVDDQGRDGDSTYNFSETVTDQDRFEIENISSTPLEIHALQATINARKDDAGTRGLRAVVTPSGQIHFGDEHLLNQDYLYEMYIFELNPETGAEWTTSVINNMEAGYELSS